MSINIVLGKQKFSASRVKLKKWIELENIRNKAIDAIKVGDRDGFCSSLYSYLFLALDSKEINFDKIEWYETAFAFDNLITLNSPQIDFPMLTKISTDREKEAWDYEHRDWFLWSHLLASAYGWSLEYIAELDIDDAIALVQEMLVDRQLKQEWEWSLSEIAYPYNSTTKKSEYKPLPRPSWMSEGIKEPKKVRILKEHIPVGIVLRWSNENPPTQ